MVGPILWAEAVDPRRCGITVLILVLSCSWATAEQAPDPQQLVMTLSASKSSYVLYEPVHVDYALENPTASPITSHVFSLAYAHGDVELSIQHEDEDAVLLQLEKVTDRWFRRPHPSRVVTLHAPKEPMRGHIRFLHTSIEDVQVLAFPKPGAYTITGRVRVGTSPTTGEALFVTSHGSRIRVSPPGPTDLQLVRALGGEKQLLWLLTSRFTRYCPRPREPYGPCLESVLAQSRIFETSVYAPYLAYEAASALAVDRGPAYGNDFSHAADVLLEVLDRWRDHPVYPDVLMVLPMTLHKAGRHQDAELWLDRYLREFGSEDPFSKFLLQKIRGVVPTEGLQRGE